MPSQNARPPSIPALTGMRFIAALMVFVSHFPVPRVTGVLSRMEGSGYAGVTFFFILSGFVIAYNHLGQFEEGVTANTPAYLLSRFARVYPLYLFCIIFAWLAAGSPSPLWPFLLAVQAWNPDVRVAFGLDGPAWSISVEAFLYVSFPLVILVFRALGVLKSRWRALGAAVAFYGALFALAWYFMHTGHGGSNQSAYDPASAHRWLYRTPLTRIFDFMLGVLGATYVTRFVGMGSMRGSAIWSAMTFVSIAAVFWMMASSRLYYTAWGWDFAYALPFLMIIVGTAVSRESWLAIALSSKPMLLLGASSFAFYLIHTMMYPMHSDAANATHPLRFYFMFLMLVIAVSVGLHITIEEPCRRGILNIANLKLSARTKGTMTRLSRALQSKLPRRPR